MALTLHICRAPACAGAEVAQSAHALVTDGAQLLVADNGWGMLKALCPPNFPPSPQRQAAPVRYTVFRAVEYNTLHMGFLPAAMQQQLDALL